MKRYNPKEIEPRWQKAWEDSKIYQASEDPAKPKKYILEYFPYPSGAAMHVGHVRNYTIGDVVSRFSRMRGYNVLHPMGWDAFGLPAENYAIKNNVSPRQAIDENTAKFKQQLIQMGFGYDWSREIDSTDPGYYKWTQWLFNVLFKRGLAYQQESLQWWCPHDKTVLANEQVEAGRCWRCGYEVEKKSLKQWFFKITDYADRLEKDLDDVDWSDSIKAMQRNWIGRSKGAEIEFAVDGHDEKIQVFTTRPDTIFGATFMVLAPEHDLVKKITKDGQRSEVEAYVKQAVAKSDIERQETSHEKTGVFTGGYAINPLNNEKIPVWIADYVLAGYGTGAIMAVPAHDERDREFAEKFNLPIRPVIAAEYIDAITPPHAGEEFVERQAVQVIVKHPTEEKYLILKKLGWDTESYSYVNGGIEQGENPQQAALRELREETGYKDHSEPMPVDEPYFARFYHEGKKYNLRPQMFTLSLELNSLEQDPISEEEQHTNELLWVDAEEVLSKVHGEGAKRAFRIYLGEQSSLTFEGVMVNSGEYDDMPSDQAREKIVEDLEKQGFGKERVNYKMRDWLISRQRYWGAPIPIIHCAEHGAVPVPDDQLPVVLPEIESYEPSGDGRSPLANVPEFVNTICPICGGPAMRETDTMDGFACSSWYFLRFADPHNDQKAFDADKAKFWLPVDDYIGGAEHAVMHLLYARMWTKVMFDEGLINFQEPFTKLRNHGMILAPDGQKMSKSKGNVISPNELIDQGYGADSIRLMELFIAPWNQAASWSVTGLGGTFRFLQRVWTLTQEFLEADKTDGAEDEQILRAIHKTINKVGADLEDMQFNTAISALMELVNELYKIKAERGFVPTEAWQFALTTLAQLLAPFAPHIAEELWQELGQQGTVHVSEWPVHDDKYLVSDQITIVVQVNGKVRANIQMPTDATEEAIVEAAKAEPRVQEHLQQKEVRKTIYVPQKLVSFVV
jgi:leucyl-tRNA synthetase